jgi:CheY-like chemotaxis protein
MPRIAIVNTSEEVAGLLVQVMQGEGFETVVAYVPDLKRRTPDPHAFLTEHEPAVVLWDIAIPYVENWTFFEQVARSAAAQGRRFVLTTTNKRALEELVGPTPAHELIGRPFDLQDIITAVHRALTDE